MKKMKNYFWLLLAASLSFTACSNVEDDEPGPGTGGEGLTSYFQDFNSVKNNQDITLPGWSTQRVLGDRDWTGGVNTADGNGYAKASAHKAMTSADDLEYWLISPALNVKDAVKKTLSFEVMKAFWQNTSSLEVYAMTTNKVDGPKVQINATLPEQTTPDYTYVKSGEIDLTGKGDVIYIGFRYKAKGGDSNSTTYGLDNFSFAGATGGGDTPGTGGGTEASPYTVADAIAKQGEKSKFVKGFIVGVVKNGVTTSIDPANDVMFSGDFDSSTNVLIADNANETDYTKCLDVKLNDTNSPLNPAFRNEVNLQQNPGNKGKTLTVQGNFVKAYGAFAGVRDIAVYKLDGTGTTPVEPDAILYEAFAADMGEFVQISLLGEAVWTINTQYKNINMSGFGADQANHENSDWLISPAIDLTGKSNVTLAFEHTISKGKANQVTQEYMKEHMIVYITDNYTDPVNTTWTKLQYTGFPAGNDWVYVKSGEIAIPAAFLKANVRIAFHYTCTNDDSATWQVNKLIVK